MVCTVRPRANGSLVPSLFRRSPLGRMLTREASATARRSLGRALGFVLLALAAGCVSTAPPLTHQPAELPRTITSGSILSVPTLDPELELEALGRSRSTPSMLRRSFLELYCRRPQAAIDAAAEVLYGSQKPSANEEAYARYLRAEAYLLQGRQEQARADLARVQELSLDPELQQRVRALTPRSSPTPADVPQLAIEQRAAWSPAAEDRSNLEPMGSPRRLTIHHSAMYFRDTRAPACAAQIKRIQKEHMGNRGYGDIGYHYLIDPAGRIWEGRDIRWQGAHASGLNNRQNIGICVLGNFLRGSGGQGPTPAQVASMRALVWQLSHKYGFGPGEVFCHSDFKATQCPGPLMTTAVAQMVHDMQGGRLGGDTVAAAGQR